MQNIKKNRDPIIKSNPLISPSPKNSFSSSSSSSDFEFTVSISPRKSSTALCPADELFCNGHLLPLHSRRNSLVPTLLPSSSTSSSADSATTSASRDSTGSSSTDSRSSSQNDPTRPTSDDAEDLKLRTRQRHDKKCKQFSFSRFSSVFRKEPKNNSVINHGGESRPPRVKGIGSTAKEVIKKCFRKVQLKIGSKSCHSAAAAAHAAEAAKDSSLNSGKTEEGARFSLSFSGNLRYPRGRSSFLPSCPASTRSSPSHSGVLRRGGVQSMSSVGGYGSSCSADMSSMEELHSAIQGAIAHCKNSLIQNKNSINPDESSSSQIVP